MGVSGESDCGVCEARGEVPRRGLCHPEARNHGRLQCCPELLWSWHSQVSTWSRLTSQWSPRLFHCAPNVPHYAKNKAVGVMKPGHCFTIEPMISEGVSASFVL